jgi:Sec-independent protein translocase protein TatA
MQILNIGPLELLLILVIAMIVLGPEEMLKTAKKLARAINRFIKSPVWKSLLSTSQEIRQLPKKLISEAGLEETVDELNKMNKQVKEFTRTNPLDALGKAVEGTPHPKTPSIAPETKEEPAVEAEKGSDIQTAETGAAATTEAAVEPAAESETPIAEKPAESEAGKPQE